MTLQTQNGQAQHGGRQGPGTTAAGTATGAGATMRFQVRLTPARSLPGFYARVSGGRLSSPVEFSSKEAFVGFLERIAEHGPGLK